jgi:phosphatidylglycerophosphate synthase
MLDRWSAKLLRHPIELLAVPFERRGIPADQVTAIGFLIGMTAIPLLALQWYRAALLVVVVNRVLDGVDGVLARRNGVTDIGGYLDIVLDFIFYSAVVFGFALADPQRNALAAAALVFAFIGTGSSFLGFAAIAAKHGRDSPEYPHKSLFYLGGLTEGTETIAALVLFCLFPARFPILAGIFCVACWITTGTRVWGGYHTLKR